ncbi:MAG TPA: ABC transporter permease, partial [Candidatus Acidoferrales bacterium]|nr:ABC transporter permease [Candidatus Acidoferrales bacterium]
MTNLLRDLHFGFRLLRKNLGFASVAILALALGIGANTAIFSVVYATLLAPLPYPHPEQLVIVWSKVVGQRNVVAAGDFLDWQRENSVFQAMAVLNGSNFNLATGNRPEQIRGGYTTPGFFDKVGGEEPLLGRYFEPEDAVPGKDHVVVLTNSLWRERFGSDPHVIGREIHMNSEVYTIIGVRPAGQADRLDTRLFVPMVFKPEQINHDFHWLLVVARMKPGVTIAQANADM